MVRAVLLGLLLLAVPAAGSAQTGVPPTVKPDATLALVSDYRFRGLSRSDRAPAVQLTADLTHISGVYAGAFVSTIGHYVADGADPEIDVYGGVRRTIGGTVLDGGLLYYAYPGTDGSSRNYAEPYLSASRTLGPLSAKLGGNVAWKQRGLGLAPGERRASAYAYGEAALAVPRTPVTVTAHYGHAFESNAATFGRHYGEWALTAAYTRKRLSLAVSYVDTDTRIDSYPGQHRNHDIAGAGALLTASLALF